MSVWCWFRDGDLWRNSSHSRMYVSIHLHLHTFSYSHIHVLVCACISRYRDSIYQCTRRSWICWRRILRSLSPSQPSLSTRPAHTPRQTFQETPTAAYTPFTPAASIPRGEDKQVASAEAPLIMHTREEEGAEGRETDEVGASGVFVETAHGLAHSLAYKSARTHTTSRGTHESWNDTPEARIGATASGAASSAAGEPAASTHTHTHQKPHQHARINQNISGNQKGTNEEGGERGQKGGELDREQLMGWWSGVAHSSESSDHHTSSASARHATTSEAERRKAQALWAAAYNK